MPQRNLLMINSGDILFSRRLRAWQQVFISGF